MMEIPRPLRPLNLGRFLPFAALLLATVASTRARADMALTPAAVSAGYSLSTFATNFPNDGSAGPVGIAFPGGGVMVSDFPGHIRVFPTHADGQDAAAVVAVDYPPIDATGLAELGGKLYLAQRTSGQVAEINSDGSFGQLVVGGLPLALGIVGNPFSGHLFVATTNAVGAAVYDVDPIAKTASVFVTMDADGLTLTGDGRTLYAAVLRERIIGFDTATKAQLFDSGAISYVDGPALGVGSLAGKIFANVNDGTVWEVDLATSAQTLIASGGSRGDLVAVDPNDGTLLLTQTDRILRLHGPPPCGQFGVASLQLTPAAATAAIGQPHSVTATATANARPVGGVMVTSTVAGANAATGTCATQSDGTCSFSYTGSKAGSDTITASASLVCSQTLTATATAAWCDAETSARLAIDEQCSCEHARNHGAYVRCVAHAVKTSVKAGTLAKSISGAVKRCAARSTCGKPGFVTCCRTTNRGALKCSIKHDAAKCKVPRGGSAHVGNHASCCDVCTAGACFVGGTTGSTERPRPSPRTPPGIATNPTGRSAGRCDGLLRASTPRTRTDRTQHMRRFTMTALLALGTSASGAPDPTRPGKLAVGVTTADAVDESRGNRTLQIEIWYPARRSRRDAEPLARRHPLVLIAHGFCRSRRGRLSTTRRSAMRRRSSSSTSRTSRGSRTA